MAREASAVSRNAHISMTCVWVGDRSAFATHTRQEFRASLSHEDVKVQRPVEHCDRSSIGERNKLTFLS